MTILDFLRANPGKHTAKQIATAIGLDTAELILEVLTQAVIAGKIIGHEQHGKIVYEHKEPNV